MQQACNQCQDLLWSYLAEELSESESNLVKVHLQGCPSCRKDAEALAPVVSSLREEVPLPATFSAELHKKLTLAAEEMATESSLRKGFLEKLKHLPNHRGFRALAPALVCLVLVVGIFSSGLFDRWNSADQIVTDPAAETPVSTSEPAPSKSPTPEQNPDTPTNPQTPPAKQPESSTPTQGSNSSNTQSKHPVTESNPAPSVAAPEPASAVVAQDPSPADTGELPAPAAVEPEDPTSGYAISRHIPRVSCLTVTDTETFLNGWQETTGNTWKSHVQDVAADEILSGIASDALVLELSPSATDSLIDYAATSEEITEDQGDTLVVITGDEE